MDRLEQNVGVADIELTADNLAEIKTAAAKIKLHGDRYPEKPGKMTEF